MPSRYAPTFELVRKRPENYKKALRLLLDNSFDDARERWHAMRQLIELIWWVQEPFIDPEEPPRVPEVRKLLDTIESASRTLTSRGGELDDLILDLMHSRPSFDDLGEVRERAGQPVDLVDDDVIDSPGLDVLE